MQAALVREGDTLAGKYRVERTLGAGGMGLVVAAHHEALNIRVAIKFLLPEALANREALSRFSREARAAAQIRSEHVARVIDVGTLDSGAPYMVMEYLEGHDLSHELQERGPLSVTRVVDYVLQAGEAIAEAHALGIVHRDLKPGNLFITHRADGSECVKVLDFGISKVQGVDQLTKTSALMGSPLYMSPEQMMSSRNVDARGDIWALGIILYELISGRNPFKGETLPELVTQVMHSTPEPLRTLRSDVPLRLDSVITRCLQKEPGDRYATVGALAADLLPFALPGSRVSVERITSIETGAGATNSASLGLEAAHSVGSGSFTQADPVPKRSFRGTILDWLGRTGVPSAQKARVDTGTRVRDFAETTSSRKVQTADEGAAWYGERPGRGWDDIHRLLPDDSVPSSAAIKSFLAANFRGCHALASSILQLFGHSLPDVDDLDFFAVLLLDPEGPHPSAPKPVLSTELFAKKTGSLESHLASMSGKRRKVVLAILDSFELASGVREKIFTYQASFNAVVVTIHLAELAKVLTEARDGGSAEPARTLLKDRLADLHTIPDLYAVRGPTKDPTSFYGMKEHKRVIVTAVEKGQALISLCGPPGSGKSSLLNMVELEFQGKRRFCRISCTDAMDRQPVAFAQEVAALLADQAPSSVKNQSQLRQTIVNSYNPTTNADVVLVLEDADWLIVALRGEKLTEDELKNVREFWMALLVLSRKPRVSVVVTGLFGFELETDVISGWENPLAKRVRVVRLEALDSDSLRRMIRDLGTQMNVHFEDAALEQVQRQTGGNIDVARRLCSRIVKRGRAHREHHALRSLTVSEKAVNAAVRDMAFIGGSFDANVIPWLSDLDRKVLRIVAVSRPRAALTIAQALGEEQSLDACRESLERLRMLGLVERFDDRERISIPILSEWARYNLDSGRLWSDRRMARKAAYLLVGASFTFTLFYAHDMWAKRKLLKTPTIESATTHCKYTAEYPEKVASGAEFTIFVFRTFPETGADAGQRATNACDDEVAVALEPGNTATLEKGAISKVKVMPCDVPLADGGTAKDEQCTRAEVRATLTDAGEGPFSFRLQGLQGAMTTFTVARDPLAFVSEAIGHATRVLEALPALAGALLAFFGDIVKLVRRARLGGS
jgi:serine/threonine-protein kinase